MSINIPFLPLTNNALSFSKDIYQNYLLYFSGSMPTLQEEGPVTVSIGNAQPVTSHDLCALRSSPSTSTTTSVSPSSSIPVSAAISQVFSSPITSHAYSSNSHTMPNAKLRSPTGISHSGSQSSSNPQVGLFNGEYFF